MLRRLMMRSLSDLGGAFYLRRLWYTQFATQEDLMLAVVNFPNEMDEAMEDIEILVDEVFDFMDEKIEEGAEAADIMAAMLIVIKLISEGDGAFEPVH